MSKKQRLLKRHAEILKIAQETGHAKLLEEANGLYDVIASLDDETTTADDENGGGNHPPSGPGKP